MNLFPNNEDATRLRQQTFLLSEFLEKKASGVKLPALYRKAIVQAHCHHAAIIKLSDEEAILKRLGLGYEILDSGCCGMAGSFGYERGKYEVSVRCGERVLLPAVRSASKDTLIIADGFSCREQIEQLTGRRALHLAEVIQMALDKGPNGTSGELSGKKRINIGAGCDTKEGVSYSRIGGSGSRSHCRLENDNPQKALAVSMRSCITGL